MTIVHWQVRYAKLWYFERETDRAYPWVAERKMCDQELAATNARVIE